ncbi:MAG: hypothetical protein QOJ64_4023 [Acidobacteriota bacterium]|jgi:hypothetical protein|nr:hypothetical protein [Acidobacteriota bacterium]
MDRVASLKFVVVVLALLVFAQCSSSNSSNFVPNGNRYSEVSVDYRDLMPGTWEGRDYSGDGNRLEMYVRFKDNDLTVDYSPSGGANFTIPYRFHDGRTIETSRYPENLIIVSHGDKVIGFRPQGNDLREDMDIIYVYQFEKLTN